MLFTPEAHEALADEPWCAERVRGAISSIVADTEDAFDDGWPTYPQDADDEREDAVGQVERRRSAYGRGRHTLWTGDLGTALYLGDCVDGAGKLPLP